MMELREFRRKHGPQTRLWQIYVDGDIIFTFYGWRQGVIRKNLDRPGSSSRETAAERAHSRALKLIKDKLNQGYTEFVPGSDTIIGDEAGTEVDFSGAPPEGLEIFKPRPVPKVGSKEYHKLMAVIKDGRELISRKYNGMKHLLTVTSDGQYLLHTRRRQEATHHYPHLINEFKKLCIPENSIVAVEIYVPSDDLGGPEDFRAMQALSRSLPHRAVHLQEREKKARAVLLAPVYWKKKPLIKELVVLDWMSVLGECVSRGIKRIRGPRYVHSVQAFYGSYERALQIMRETGIEGLVIYDGEACFEEKAFNFRGKAERPPCWKQKPINESDFIAVWDPHGNSSFPQGGEYGRGKNRWLPRSLALYQYDQKGRLVYVSNVGTGLDEKTRLLIREKMEKHGHWTGVVSVEFTERKYVKKGEASNALTFPAFKKLHEDKEPSECVNNEL